MRRPLSLPPHRREGMADRTSFAPLLGEMLARMSSARAAILVDSEGETVEHEGAGEPFDLMVAAAHARIAISAIERSTLGSPRLLAFRGRGGGVLARALSEGYALVVLMQARAGLLGSRRALDAGAWRLAREAGLTFERPAWFPVRVEHAPSPLSALSHRPVMVRDDRDEADGTGHACTILGTIAGLPRRERGFRVRLPSRAELNLVREPGDHWYADVPLEGVDGRDTSKASTNPSG